MSKYCIGVDVKFDPFFRMVLGMELVNSGKVINNNNTIGNTDLYIGL